MCLRAFLLERMQVWGEREHEKVRERDKVCVRVYTFEALLLCFFPFSPSSQAFWQLVLSFPSMTFAAMGSLPQMFSSMGGTFSWAPPASASANPARPVQPISTDKKHFLFSRNQPKIFNFWGVFGEKKTLLICQNG